MASTPAAKISVGRRIAALVLALLFPTGSGLIFLGRYISGGLWHFAGIVSFAASLLSPVGGCVAVMIVGLGSIIHTIVTTPPEGGAPRGARGLIPFLALFLAFSCVRWAERAYLVEPFMAPSESMMPTLLRGDQFVINKLRRPWRRGDVVVFKAPPEPQNHFVKRIVALAGDAVEIRNRELIVNGAPLPLERGGRCSDEVRTAPLSSIIECQPAKETSDTGKQYTVVHDLGLDTSDYPQSAADCGAGTNFNTGRCVVATGHVFVLGDNRDHSYDSRAWGAVPVGDVAGRAVGIFISFDGWTPRLNRMGIDL